MKKNEYDSLDEFIYEYSTGREFSWENEENRERFQGIEFESSGVFYRMCREAYDEKFSPILSNGKPGIYNVMIMHCEKAGYPTAEFFESIGWYDSLASLLKECKIGEKFFRDVIIAEDTEILGKD